MNGATGNFSAHAAAAPQVDWRSVSRSVIEGSEQHKQFVSSILPLINR
jgi:hypothetical protein